MFSELPQQNVALVQLACYKIHVLNVAQLDHPAWLSISSMETPAALCAEVEAALVLCGLKTLVSIPAFSITTLIHRRIVSPLTALYGFWKLMNNLLSDPLRDFVFSR